MTGMALSVVGTHRRHGSQIFRTRFGACASPFRTVVRCYRIATQSCFAREPAATSCRGVRHSVAHPCSNLRSIATDSRKPHWTNRCYIIRRLRRQLNSKVV
jgi:hypothetical protein